MQRAHARLMTRTLLRMHRHIQKHTHTPWAVSFRLWGWTQGRCGRRHRVSVSAAAGTGSHAQRKQANAACACHKPVVWPWVVCMDRSHLSTARMQVNDKQCTRTMETGRAWPRLVSIHDRTRMQCIRRGNDYRPAASPALRRTSFTLCEKNETKKNVICCEYARLGTTTVSEIHYRSSRYVTIRNEL